MILLFITDSDIIKKLEIWKGIKYSLGPGEPKRNDNWIWEVTLKLTILEPNLSKQFPYRMKKNL